MFRALALAACLIATAAQGAEPGYAARLIAASGTSAQFADDTRGPSIAVRHRASGMVCAFADEPDDRSGDRIAASANGDDASCVIHANGFVVTLTLHRLPAPMTADQALSWKVSEFREAHPDLGPYNGESFEFDRTDGPPRPRIAFQRGVIREGGRELYVRIAASVAQGWLIEEQVTGPLENGGDGDLLAIGEMFVAVDGVTRTLPDDRPTP